MKRDHFCQEITVYIKSDDFNKPKLANSVDEYNDSDGSDESDDSEAFRQTESNSVYKGTQFND